MMAGFNEGIFNIQPGESAKEADSRRKVAMALLAQGTSGEPIRAWSQGLARVAQGLLGGYDLGRQDKKDLEDELAVRNADIPGLPPAPGAAPSAMPGPPAVPPGPAVTSVPKTAMPSSAPPAPLGAIPLDAQRPPQAEITSALNGPGAKPAILGPSEAPPPPPGPSQQTGDQLRKLWTNPATRGLAAPLIVEWAKKQLPDYDIKNLPNGDLVVTDKNNPRNVQVVKPPGVSDSLTDFEKKKEIATTAGKAQGTAQATLGPEVDATNLALKTIDQLEKHPGRTTGVVGALGQAVGGLPGGESRGFFQLLKQAKSQVFAQAYQTLRGGGSISNIEGAKIEGGMARLDAAQTDKDFQTALDDLRSVFTTVRDRAQKQAAGIPSASTSGAASLKQKYGLE